MCSRSRGPCNYREHTALIYSRRCLRCKLNRPLLCDIDLVYIFQNTYVCTFNRMQNAKHTNFKSLLKQPNIYEIQRTFYETTCLAVAAGITRRTVANEWVTDERAYASVHTRTRTAHVVVFKRLSGIENIYLLFVIVCQRFGEHCLCMTRIAVCSHTFCFVILFWSIT